MTSVDTRQLGRSSFLLVADAEFENATHRLKVRNLSSRGMMAEGDLDVERGDQLKVTLRNIDQINAAVVWVEGNRFGLAFAKEIDPQLARKPLTADKESEERLYRPVASALSTQPDEAKLRKI